MIARPVGEQQPLEPRVEGVPRQRRQRGLGEHAEPVGELRPPEQVELAEREAVLAARVESIAEYFMSPNRWTRNCGSAADAAEVASASAWSPCSSRGVFPTSRGTDRTWRTVLSEAGWPARAQRAATRASVVESASLLSAVEVVGRWAGQSTTSSRAGRVASRSRVAVVSLSLRTAVPCCASRGRALRRGHRGKQRERENLSGEAHRPAGEGEHVEGCRGRPRPRTSDSVLMQTIRTRPAAHVNGCRCTRLSPGMGATREVGPD